MAGTILFLYGADTYRSQEKLRGLKGRYIDASLGDTNLATLDGASLTFPELVRHIQALPFLAKTRLVIVRDLLLAGQKDVQELTLGYLPKIPDSTVVCFFENGLPDQRTALFKRLAKEKFAEGYAPLVGPPLAGWLQAQSAARQLDLAPPVRAYLLAAVGSDLWRMASELDKLAAFAASLQKTELTTAHVQALVHREDEADVFALIEAIARNQTGQALQMLETLLGHGEAELYLLSMIAYQFRTMLAAAEAYAAGSRSQFELSRAAGIAPFVAQKMLPLVREISFPNLLARFERLLTYDVAIKTGELPPRDALELLIVELAGASSTKMTKFE